MSESPQDAPFFVVNPNAANGKLGRRWESIAEQIEASLGSIAFALTEAQDHATELAREAAQAGHKLIVSCGGDGTHNEVVNGLVEDDEAIAPGLVLGMIPYGTGGDLRKTLGVTGSIEQHIHRLKEGVDHPVDVGRVDYAGVDGDEDGHRYFINIASAGMSGLVDRIVNSSSKRLGGKMTFMLASLKALRRYSYPKVDIQVDDNPILTVPVTMAVVANGRWFGGGMKVAPDALMDDGLFDVVVTTKTGTLSSAMAMRDLYKGTHLRHPFVHHMRGRTVTVTPHEDNPDAAVYLDVDGEAPGQCPARFTLLDKVLSVRVSPGAMPGGSASAPS